MPSNIRDNYYRRVEGIQALLMKQGGLTEERILQVTESIVRREPETNAQREQAVKQAKSLADNIEEKCFQTISEYSPQDYALSFIQHALSTSGRLTRCVLRANKISKYADNLNFDASVSSLGNSVRRIARSLQDILKDSLDAYITRDKELASDAVARTQDIQEMHAATFRELLTHMLEDTRTVPTGMSLNKVLLELLVMCDEVRDISDETLRFSNMEPNFRVAGRKTGTQSIARDQFDMLRDLDELLAELEDHLRSINNPDRVTNNVRYVKAASESLRSFISNFERTEVTEVPEELPRTLHERLKSPELKDIEGVAGIIQKITDAIAKIFLT